MSREQYREYAYWFQGVEGENCDTTKKIGSQPIFHSKGLN